MQKLIDLEKLISLGMDGTANLHGDWAITTYTKTEAEDRGINTFPSSCTEYNSPSWPDFGAECKNEKFELSTWSDGTTVIQVYYVKERIIGKALCGKHDATIQLSINNGECFHLCDKFRESNSDFSQLTAMILCPILEFPYTGDRCLGVTCAAIEKHNIIQVRYQRSVKRCL